MSAMLVLGSGPINLTTSRIEDHCDSTLKNINWVQLLALTHR